MTAFDSAQDAARCIEIVRRAAAAEIMPRFRQLSPGAIRAKTAPDDLVTDADIAAEEAMTDAFLHDFPGALVIGEEAVAADPRLLDQLPGSELTFVIDPVDGTWNFAAGLAVFGVILAVIERGETVLGLLYDPVMDDWIIARKGFGTWYDGPKAGSPQRLQVGGNSAVETAHGLVSPFYFPPGKRARVAQQLTEFGRIDSLRCSCHEYRLLAQGKMRFALSGQTKVWDHAAGVLAVHEAGGVSQMIDGGDYAPDIGSGHLVVADDEALLDDVAQRFGWLAEDGG